MILEQRNKGYLYLVVGALLIGATLPVLLNIILFVLGVALVGYGTFLLMAAYGTYR